MANAVREATSEYRTEQDIVQQFLNDNCDLHPEHIIEKKLLFDASRDWCEQNGEIQAQKRTKTWLTRQMTKRGFENGGHGGASLWGLRLNK